MEEQKDRKEYPWCPWWHTPHGHWHPGVVLIRLLIGIIIVLGAFAIGVKLGELRASMYYSGYEGYGYAPMQYMMGGWGNGYGAPYGNYQYEPYGMPMMRGYYPPNYYYQSGMSVPAAQPAPAQPAATSTKK